MKRVLVGASVYQNGEFSKEDILIENGKIVSVGSAIEKNNADVTNCENKYIVPGFADVHVHLREPGFSYKETIRTGTLAAAHGGYTLVCAMPNLKPAPDSRENLNVELDIIKKDACIEVIPYGCITKGQTGRGELVDYPSIAGDVVAFSDDGKGVQEGFRMQDAMIEVHKLNKAIVAHCEDESLLHGGWIHEGRYAKEHNMTGISSSSEYKQVIRDIELVRKTHCQYHVCHVSTKESVEAIRQAKREKLPVTCETAPHYLIFCEDDLVDDGRFKMNPPLRSKEDRQALIEGIQDGTIDIIATDHAPHSAEEKTRGLKDSLMGIVGLENSFAVLYTYLVKSGIISFERLIEMMSVRPREIFNLPRCEIKAGNDADFTILDINCNTQVNSGNFLSKGKFTPFDGMKVSAEILETVYKGRVVWQK